MDDAKWDPETNSVISPWAVEGIDNISETQGAVFEALGVDFEDIDLSEMIDGNNRQSTAEDEARELLILQNNLPANGIQRKVGASGASARSDASEAPSQALTSDLSTSDFNLAGNYKKTKLEMQQMRGGLWNMKEAMEKAGIGAVWKQQMKELGVDIEEDDNDEMEDENAEADGVAGQQQDTQAPKKVAFETDEDEVEVAYDVDADARSAGRPSPSGGGCPAGPPSVK